MSTNPPATVQYSVVVNGRPYTVSIDLNGLAGKAMAAAIEKAQSNAR